MTVTVGDSPESAPPAATGREPVKTAGRISAWATASDGLRVVPANAVVFEVAQTGGGWVKEGLTWGVGLLGALGLT